MKIIINKKIKENYSEDDLRGVVAHYLDKDYSIEIDEKRRHGQYMILEDDENKIYILLSTNKNEGRNSYLSQFFSTAYSDFILDDTSKKKKFEVYLFKNKNTKTPYNLFICRLIKTCGIKIINEQDQLNGVVEKFNTYRDIENYRLINKSKNSSNNSTFFSEEKKVIKVFGKVFGANGKESALICFALTHISTKPIWLYQVYENNTEKMSEKDIQALARLKVELKEKINKLENLRIDINSEKDLRNTPKFHYNLLEKFKVKKCLICPCNIGEIIIASHIHRVTDIKNDFKLSVSEKIDQIVDGENGLWLCSNHDKLFEYGLIYFRKDNLNFSDKLLNDQLKFVKDITKDLIIPKEFFNEKMDFYIEKHLSRFGN